MASAEDLRVLREELFLLKAEIVSLKTKLEEQENSKSSEKPYRDFKKNRDLFTTKKGFSDVPNFDGKAEKYDDWRFKATTFIEIEDNFKELIEYIEKLPNMPTEDNLNEWEDEKIDRDVKTMNEQLYNFLCLNLKDEALTMVKNMKLKPRICGVASWWKFQHDCQSLTGQRIQALANSIYKPSRVKKYADVTVAMEKWERDLNRFVLATNQDIAEETKTFSLRQLVPDELDQLITANSNTLKNYEQVKAYVNEQVSLRRDKKSNGPVQMDLDHLAEAPRWSWEEDGAEKTPCNAIHAFQEAPEERSLEEKVEALFSFMKGKGKGKGGKGKGKGGKDTRECYHCGKQGHIARDCWQKDAEMEQYRNAKGKGGDSSWSKGGKGYKGSNPWNKGGAPKGGGEKGGGNAWGKGGGGNVYWFDQPGEMGQFPQQTWAFAVSEKPASRGRAQPPPGLPPPIVTSKTWAAFETNDEEEEEWPEVSKAYACQENAKLKKSRLKNKLNKKASEKDDDAFMEKLIKENTVKRIGFLDTQARSAPVKSKEQVFVLTEKEKPVEANMVQGPWRQKEADWIRVQSVMDSGCGCSVAPPGMCPAYPIHESAGSLRGQEFMSASEDTLPNLGEQVLNVVMGDGKETSIKYAIADVSRALNAVTEICDHGNRVIFGRGGGVIENLQTGKQTPFKREGNIYCLDYWVKPFPGQVR